MNSIYFYETDIGRFSIIDDGEAIISISSGDDSYGKDVQIKETELIKEASRQLLEYISGNRKEFNLPLSFKGTDFQKRVWNALLDIPYGEVRSYKDIAEAVGSPKAFRAVGNANNKNPIMIVAP